MTTIATLMVALTGAFALVAAAVLEAPPARAARPALAEPQQDGRDDGPRATDMSAPALPGNPHIHAGARGGCPSRPGDSVN